MLYQGQISSVVDTKKKLMLRLTYFHHGCDGPSSRKCAYHSLTFEATLLRFNFGQTFQHHLPKKCYVKGGLTEVELSGGGEKENQHREDQEQANQLLVHARQVRARRDGKTINRAAVLNQF